MQAEAQEQEFEETTSVELDDDSDEVIETASDDEKPEQMFRMMMNLTSIARMFKSVFVS